MANSYFSNQNLDDITIQSEDGGGISFTDKGKFLFGAKLPNVNQQLNEEFYQGNVDINANTNSSFIGIMNAESEAIDIDIPSTNQYSLFTPPENTVVQTNPPKDDCGNLFNDASTVLLNWENDNTSRGNKVIVYDGGWDPYGANGSGIRNGELQKAQTYLLDNYWNTNNKNTGKFSIAADGGNNKNDPKLLIKNLPPGLNIMAAQFNYNAKQWWTRILAAVGSDWLGSNLGVPYRLTPNLGPSDADSYEYLLVDGTKSGKFVYNPYKVAPDPKKEFTLKGDERIQLFIDQYDQIIDLYKQDKVKFLGALRDETIRYYIALDGTNTGLLSFHKQYVEKAYNLALKYVNCPIETMAIPPVTQDPNQSTQSPPPTPTPTTPPTTEEELEGIYEANFLPASEDEGAQLFEKIIVDDNNNEPLSFSDVEQINRDEEFIKIENNKNKTEENKDKTPVENKKVGSTKSLIQNNTTEYGNLGNVIYHPTPLYNQNDPEWGSFKSGTLTMGGYGCAYNTACMLLGNSIKDATKTTPYNIWNSGVKGTKSVEVNWPSLAQVVNKSFSLVKGSISKIDETLKTKPVGFEWRGGVKFPNGWGWSKGYNLYKGKKKGNYKGESKGVSYTCCNQHWMVITGKNSDGTYTVFDPSGGIIRKNQTADQIEAGLNRIIYVN